MTRHSPAPEAAALAQARHAYEETSTPAGEIAAALGVTRAALFRLVVRENWKRRPPVAFGARAPRDPSEPARSDDTVTASKKHVSKRKASKRQASSPREAVKPPKADRGPLANATPDAGLARRKAASSHHAAPASSAAPLAPEALRAKATARIARAIDRQLDLIDAILSETRAAPSPAAERTARTLASLTRTLKELAQLGAAAPQESDDDEPPRDLAAFRKELAERLDRIVAEAAARPADEDDG